MTDKQIIDDLNTRCPYHCNEKIGQCNNPSQETPHTYCIDNKDCIYKQYARKEQECEEFKELYNYYAFDRRKPENITELKICINGVNEELIRLQQENEELKIYIESNEQQVKEVETLVMDNDRLINELDQLKEQLEAYKMEAEEGYEINAELKAELETEINWHKTSDEISKVNSEYTAKLKQTLEEIREICNNNDELKGGFNLVDCDKYKLGKHNLAQKIIAKINEVENGNI